MLYLFFSTSIGIFLGTVARSMPQLGLLFILVAVPMMLLSGSNTPLESMPLPLQYIMQASPSTHFVSFAQAILFRGAGLRRGLAAIRGGGRGGDRLPGTRAAPLPPRDRGEHRLSGAQASTRSALSPSASTARRSPSASATQPAVGAKSGVATCRKIAEPRPGSTGASFQPSTASRS